MKVRGFRQQKRTHWVNEIKSRRGSWGCRSKQGAILLVLRMGESIKISGNKSKLVPIMEIIRIILSLVHWCMRKNVQVGSERQQIKMGKLSTVSGLVVAHSRWDQEGSPSVLFIKPWSSLSFSLTYTNTFNQPNGSWFINPSVSVKKFKISPNGIQVWEYAARSQLWWRHCCGCHNNILSSLSLWENLILFLDEDFSYQLHSYFTSAYNSY